MPSKSNSTARRDGSAVTTPETAGNRAPAKNRSADAATSGASGRGVGRAARRSRRDGSVVIARSADGQAGEVAGLGHQRLATLFGESRQVAGAPPDDGEAAAIASAHAVPYASTNEQSANTSVDR